VLRIFLGYDKRESVAYHVCSHSILKRSSIPVSITPLNKDCLRGFFTRPRGAYDSTDFAITRFLVPFLCDFQGFAFFMDGDMLCLGDVAELANYTSLMDKYGTAVRVVKHEYVPTEETKFLGNIQTKYAKKNWSSVIGFNNALCTQLTPEYVEKAPGLELHQFAWLKEHQIGQLPARWNVLVGVEDIPNPSLLHFTKATPCFDMNQDYAELWKAEYEDMIGYG
jgi:hypothetical protein